MKSISKLKDEARRHEQREEWEKAIQAYLQVLKIADEGDAEVELPLYNRLGDLCVRLGRPQEAVRHYEQAADRYADAGLYNNAIALCNKALRYNPDRLELVRKLGQFSAQQGFVTDARRYFLDYAERQFSSGKVGDALKALEDFANLSDDPEIREMLGRQLNAHGRFNDAVEELRRAHAMRVSAGDTTRAEALRQEILTIDPHATVEGGVAPPSQAARGRDSATELPGLVEIETADAATFDVASYEPPGTATPAGADAGPIAGFEATGAPALDDVGDGVIEGLESTSLDDSSVEAGDLTELGIERDEASFGSGGARDAETFDLAGTEDIAPPAGLPGLDDADSSFDLPLLGDGPFGTEEPTPLQPPQIDEPAPPLDLPAAESDAPLDPLAGDLRIDLTSISGFLFPAIDEEPDATLTPQRSRFDLPLLEDEPEQPPAELPLLEDAPPARPAATEEPAPPVKPAPAVKPRAATEPAAAADAPPAETAQAEGVTIPAIELPTWDTDPVVEEVEAEPYEAAWVETPVADEQEAPTELPTFAYEDEEEAAEPEEVPEDEDPLGLAAHLAARGITPPPAGAPPGEEGASEDWLEDIGADEPEPWAEGPVIDDAGELAAGPADAAVEDIPAAAARADEAAREMRPAAPPPAGDGYIDLGALVADDEDEESTRFRVRETEPTGDEDRDFAELLSQFKSKVQEHLPPEDAAAHYDLGLAFKEMGLIDEAIGEFQVALRAGHMRLKVYEELGQCFMQKEQYNIAEKVLSRALDMKFDDELELLGVYYHLGRAYEALGRREQARDAYERVLGMDINFEDVTARLARL